MPLPNPSHLQGLYIRPLSLKTRILGLLLLLLGILYAGCGIKINNTGPTSTGPRLTGWVDMHTHPMAHLGFGGKLLYGAPDTGTLMPDIPVYNRGNIFPVGCRSYVPATTIVEALGDDRVAHGGWHISENSCGDLIRKEVISTMEGELNAQSEHFLDSGAYGFPMFNGWPAFNDITHQQMWIDWIHRTYEGGLRVMVALAVNNATLAASVMGPSDRNGDDVSSANIQIEQIQAMVERNDFMEIALSPQDLRRIVSEDKLAIILGLEIDNIGNFHLFPNLDPNVVNDLSRTLIRVELERLHAQGIRYLFPVHVLDNPFGGTAIYQELFNMSNFHQTGSFWDVGCAMDSTITFRLPTQLFDPTAPIGTREFWDQVFSRVDAELGQSGVMAIKLGLNPAARPPLAFDCRDPQRGEIRGHVNQRGLTPLGRFAIEEMMRQGIMIDVDHMSNLMVEDVLDLAETYDYPVNSGHSGPRSEMGNENGKTPEQYERILNLFGIIGLGHGGNIQTFADTYHQVFQLASSRHQMQICIGTDANGLFSLPDSSNDSRIQLRYSEAFPRSTLGNQTWDINEDGVAHYGLFADYIKLWGEVNILDGSEDIRNDYLPIERDVFFLTAEGFAQMWEAVEEAMENLPDE